MNHDDEASSSRMRPKTYAPWSDIYNDLLLLFMMRLGFGDYYSFRGICKSWRLLAHSNKNKFMASRPPMSITISTDSNENVCCYLEDFEGRKFKTILPHSAVGGECVGVTCGYLIFFTKKTRNFWLVNPITRHQLHFPHFPTDYHPAYRKRAILVISPSITGLVFLVVNRGQIWFSIEGKGAWNHVSLGFYITDLYVFKGKVYTLSLNFLDPVKQKRCCLCELRLNPELKFTLLETRNLLSSHMFVSSGENLYIIGWVQVYQNSLGEVDRDEMKWVKPCEKTMEQYTFFLSDLNLGIAAVKQESWADPRSRSRVKYDGGE